MLNTIKPLLKIEQAPHFSALKSKLHIFVKHYLYWKFHSTALLMFSFLLETINTFILKILQIDRQTDSQAEKDRQRDKDISVLMWSKFLGKRIFEAGIMVDCSEVGKTLLICFFLFEWVLQAIPLTLFRSLFGCYYKEEGCRSNRKWRDLGNERSWVYTFPKRYHASNRVASIDFDFLSFFLIWKLPGFEGCFCKWNTLKKFGKMEKFS